MQNVNLEELSLVLLLHQVELRHEHAPSLRTEINDLLRLFFYVTVLVVTVIVKVQGTTVVIRSFEFLEHGRDIGLVEVDTVLDERRFGELDCILVHLGRILMK